MEPGTGSFARLERADQLDALVQCSFARPVLIVKHSPACGTSYQALDELQENRDRLAGLDLHVIDVLRHRPLSQSVSARFQIRHESPQVLLLLNGRVQWSASHFGVTTARIARAVHSASIAR